MTRKISITIAIVLLTFRVSIAQDYKPSFIKTDKLKKDVTYFNLIDSGDVQNYVPNDKAYDWILQNTPLFECPDSTIQTVYNYRWWTFRKHLKQTPEGFVFTEFIIPVSHAGKYNAISSALGHQVYEGRWLHDPKYIQQYLNFWFFVDSKEKKQFLHRFSGWVEDAVYNFYLVNNDLNYVKSVIPAMDADYKLWEEERRFPDGLFWQYDVKDAMEESISGSRKFRNKRPSINSYMYGNAVAMEKMAVLTGVDSLKDHYRNKAAELKNGVENKLWSNKDSFFETGMEKGDTLANAREAIGFTPWYFNLPDDNDKYVKAWSQIVDTAGFMAPWGLTTAERRHPQFRTHGVGKCEWDGAIWPFASTQTLKGLSHLLTDYKHKGGMTPQVFYNAFHTYASSHQMDGVIYIGEYQDEKTGAWLKGNNPRSRYYNHSGFCDLVINDLVGFKPRVDNKIDVDPLLPANEWDWFCLENVLYHGKQVSILWDKSGKKYNKGKGFHIYVDNKEVYHGNQLKHVTIDLK
ncbi:MGH1-like glycoside hydrolase domain-containing protein [Pinibacter soli]|uniref:Glycoside hydrolase n=1 Tax=Pinibacter soli TaxID=3044211 RepID=A0ABT6RFI6_9BACT|nr:glycosyl hydrolase family 65 protein [Pinibacter soli]MDI3321165.1 glycoside hydrolase [Pinibacter soli]